jgi:dTMP kinase
MAKKNLKRGIFITFEGPEGCGKSTHSRLLRGFLKKSGYSCVLTREPGGTKLGEEIRQILLHSKGVEISSLAELFLFEAARSQLIAELICPSLVNDKIVICDRFTDATLCYQGYAGGVDLRSVKTINYAATNGMKPDLTILLDVDTATGLSRAKAKGIDRMETKEFAYHEEVRSGYLKLAKIYPERIKVIRVEGSVKDTQERVRQEAECVIQKYKRPK